MRLRITLILACALVLSAQNMTNPGGKQLSFSASGKLNPPRGYLGCTAPGDEILKAEYKKSVDDIRELSKLADDLKGKFAENNNGAYSVSLTTVKELEEIEKLAKRIQGRLKRCW